MGLGAGWRRAGTRVALILAGGSAAVAAPAQQPAPVVVPAVPATGPMLPASQAPQSDPDPNSPLAPMPDIGVDWPDLSTGAATETQAANSVASTVKYGWRIDGLDGVGSPLLRERFAQLSSLAQNEKKDANPAQLDRRAREDADLLVTLLRAGGYYDARAAPRVEPQVKGRVTVVLVAEPGALYRLTGVTVNGAPAPLTGAFAVKDKDAVDADAIAAAEARLRVAAGEQGYPFAKIGEPEVVIDREAQTATLAVDVTTGEKRRFGEIRANANNGVFDGAHVQDIARFEPGDPYRTSEVDDLRRALIQTGLVSTAQVTPVPGKTPDTVDLDVLLAPAPVHTIAGELGYGTGEGARAEVSWTHRNLFPPEGALTLRSVLGTQEQLGSVIFRRNNFHARDRVLTAQFAAAHTNRDAYDAKTVSLAASIERQSNIFFQKVWTWSLGAEVLASDERDVIAATGQPRRRTFFIAAAPVGLGYDGSDDLLNPSRGFRLSGRASPELSLQGSVFGYTRVQIDASAYHPLTKRVVIAGRTRVGTILGAPRDEIAPSRRFYAGGGASVRGYGFQSIGPRDVNNDPIGGRSLAEFGVEARVRVLGNFGLVPFLDGGNIYTGVLPDLTGFRFGTGIGVRYYSNFGPIRIDVGTPINPQKGDTRVAVYVSLGQAF